MTSRSRAHLAAVVLVAALSFAGKPTLPSPAESLRWSADSTAIVASDGRQAVRLDLKAKGQELVEVGLSGVTLSTDGRFVFGARDRSFVVHDVASGQSQEVPVPERDGKPVILHQGPLGEVRVTRTVAHHKLQRTGGQTGDPDPEPTKNYVGLWLDPRDPLIYIDTGYGLEIHHLWTGRMLRVLDSGRRDQVIHDAVRDDQGRLVVAMSDQDGFRVWTPPDPPGPTWTLPDDASTSLSGDGRVLAVGEAGGVVLYSTVTREPLEVLKTKEPVARVAFSPDATHVVAALQDGTFKVFEVEVEGARDPIDREASDTDVGRLRSGALTGSQPPLRQPVAQHALAGGTSLVGWAPSGQLMGWVGAELSGIDPATGAVTPLGIKYAARGRPFAWAADGRTLAVASDTEVRVLDTSRGRTLQRLPTGGGHDQLEWRGSVLVTDAGSARARAWDPSTGQAFGEPFSTSPDPTARYVASPDGQLLAVRGRVPQVIHSRSGRTIASLDAQYGGVGAVAWSPDARRLATAGNDGTVLLWDAASWTPTALLEGANGRELAFSPDGKRLLSASWDGAVIADVETGELVEALPFDGLLASVDWGAPGIVMCDRSGNIFLWE